MIGAGPAGEEKQPPALDDPGLLHVLATEHWSLLATRSLTYSESLSRVSMFLSVLSGAVIALALVAQADHFGNTFVLVAILILSVVLFVGVATAVRLGRLNEDDLRWVMGMNRLRHAYLERHPEAAQYFVASAFDDFGGVALTTGATRPVGPGIGQLGHGVQTLPGMISILSAVVAASLSGLIAHALGGPQWAVLATAIGTFLVAGAFMFFLAWRSFTRFRAEFAPRFPSTGTPKRQ
ncbi:MAG TPA: hypothetical protein VGA47_11805 [Candidatus Dormibacteraeota bacterium]